MKNKLFVLGAVVIAILAFSFLSLKKKEEEKKEVVAQAASVNPSILVRPHNPVLGNPAAKVTVVEYYDPECEACRRFHPVVKNLVKEYSSRVKFVFRYMPYHHNSELAAVSIEEARDLEKYEEALDILFEKQPIWGSHENPRPELIATYLRELGIPKERLDPSDLTAKHAWKVRQDQADGVALGVRGTPSFFVNGMPVELGEPQLRAAIEQALTAAN